jgi:4-amino-4-deoxy-L-arabinose transferase-like glycosyltransferase
MRRFFTSQCIVFIVIFFLFGFFALFFLDSYHDSFVLVPAIDLLQGKILFRDSFTQYGALFSLLHAVGLKIFGIHGYTIRFTTLLFYAGTAVIVWSVYRRFLPRLWNCYAMFLWIILSPISRIYFLSWSSVPAAFFQCASLLFIIWFIEQKKIVYVTLAGAISALAFWTRQPVGILNSGAIILAFLLLWFTNYFSFKKTCSILWWFIVGNILGFLPIFIWLLANNAIQAWWYQSFEMQAVWAKIVKGTSPDQILKSLILSRYIKDWKNIPTHAIWILIPLSTIFVGFSKFRQLLQKGPKNTNHALLLMISCVSAASWHQYYPAGDPYHYFWANIPIVGLFIYTLYHLIKTTKPTLLKPGVIILFILTLLIGTKMLTPTFAQIQTAKYTASAPSLIRGIPVRSNEKIFYESISATLNVIFSKFPEKTYINESGHGFYPLFHPSNFKSFRGVFVDWESMTEAASPGVGKEKEQYIADKRPFIFAKNKTKYPNYCTMLVPSQDDPPVKLFVPQELVSQLQLLTIYCDK